MKCDFLKRFQYFYGSFVCSPDKLLTMSTINRSQQLTVGSVVLADDDQDDHDFFRDALKEISPGTRLTIVKNGEELIDLLKHYLPDFIFLDLEMPCKNGLECLTEIRSNDKLKSIPVVIFSSTTRPANIETAYEMGADLFFIKPSIYKELTSSINAILALNWKDPSKIKEQYFI